MHTRELTLSFPETSNIPMTGERYVPGFRGPIRAEHHHRYLFAANLCLGKRVLDIASGEGYGSYLLAQTAQSVTGVDVDAEVVRNASEVYKRPNLHFETGNASRLESFSGTFDAIVSFETLEHIAEQEQFVEQSKRLLTASGFLIISTPEREQYRATLPEPNPFHLRELSGEEFRNLLGRSFRFVKVLEQRSLFGSLMIDRSASGSRVERFESAGNSSYALHKTIGAPFLVAVASDDEFTIPDLSMMSEELDFQKTIGDLGYAESEMWRLQNEIPRIQQSCSELESTVRALSEEVKELKLTVKLAQAESEYLRNRLQSQRGEKTS